MRFIYFLFVLFSVVGYSNERKTPSSIKNVIVYLSGAQITREATVTLQPGINEIVFTELSPLINENSIQVSGLKTASHTFSNLFYKLYGKERGYR